MRTTAFRLISLLACAAVTANCASYRQASVRPPRLTLPDAAAQPCSLPLLPADATQADFEATYYARGAAVVVCDSARRLAVDTLTAERQLIDEWLKLEEDRRKGWLHRLVPIS